MSYGEFRFSDDIIKLNPELAKEVATAPASKYKNVSGMAKGLRFQSGHEAVEMGKLILLDEKHLIFGLRLQVKFPLQGSNFYVADAVYLDDNLKVHVIDAKGFLTPVFKIKAKLFKERYGQDIELV